MGIGRKPITPLASNRLSIRVSPAFRVHRHGLLRGKSLTSSGWVTPSTSVKPRRWGHELSHIVMTFFSVNTPSTCWSVLFPFYSHAIVSRRTTPHRNPHHPLKSSLTFAMVGGTVPITKPDGVSTGASRLVRRVSLEVTWSRKRFIWGKCRLRDLYV